MDYPLLHESVNEDVNKLGFGKMTKVISGSITKDENQVPSLSMQYLANGDPLAKEIKEGRVIIADASAKLKRQQFRITHTNPALSEDGKEVIDIQATHVGGDLSYMTIGGDVTSANTNPEQLFGLVKKEMTFPMPNLNFTSDIKTVSNAYWEFKNVDNVMSMLLGKGHESMTFEQLFDGQFVFDNTDIRFDKNAGINTGITIKYGDNIRTLEQDTQIEDTYTAIYPYATQTKEKPVYDTTQKKAFTGNGTTQWLGSGGLPVYDKPTGKKIDSIPNGTYVNITSYIDDSKTGKTWYETNKGWVDSSYISFTKDKNYSSNKVTGRGHIAFNIEGGSNVIIDYTGVADMQYLGNGVQTYTSPYNNRKPTGRYLRNGDYYKVDKMYTDEKGHSWYRVSTDEWVDGQYISFEKTGGYVYTDTTMGMGTLKNAENQAYSSPSTSAATGLWYPAGRRLMFRGKATAGNATFYRFVNGSWINADDIDFDTNPTDVTPKDMNSSDNLDKPDVIDTIMSYRAPAHYDEATGKTYKSGNVVNIYAQAEAGADGGNWYMINDNEWIDADYVSFSNPTDVDPNGETGEEEEPEVTLYLPEKLLEASNAKDFDVPRIMNVDLTEYNIDTVDKLRRVAKAYAEDYELGKPQVALTIAFDQMVGELEKLKSVDLYDRANVFFPDFEINRLTEVVETVWDVVAQRYETITFGKRPDTVIDTLNEFRDQAYEDAKGAMDSKDKVITDQMDDIMQQIHNNAMDIANTQDDVDAGQRAVEQYRTQTMQAINNYQADISSWLNGTGGTMIYGKTALTSKNGDGTSLKLSSLGLGYFNSSGLVKTAIDSRGHVYADEIVGKSITGYTINAANIYGGYISGVQIDGGNFKGSSTISLSTAGSNQSTVISHYGISTPAVNLGDGSGYGALNNVGYITMMGNGNDVGQIRFAPTSAGYVANIRYANGRIVGNVGGRDYVMAGPAF